jgi:DNA-binding HxlR family transcriptional regulator
VISDLQVTTDHPEAQAPHGRTIPAVTHSRPPVSDPRQPETDARPPLDDVPNTPTSLERALDRVGDRWSLLVVEALLDGSRRFGELQEQLSGIAPNILTDRLRRLERVGIVRATPYQQRPTRFAYGLTADGHDLASALRLLADWGARTTPDAEPLRHVTCGTPLEARWYCPTCASPVEDVDAPSDRVL